jgi:mono/diheme cytochrome c family protein
MKKELIFSLALLSLLIAACGGQNVAPVSTAPAQADSQPVVVSTSTAIPASVETDIPTEAAMPATEAPAAGTVSFANDVMPILALSCNDCHGGKQTKAGLDLTTYDSLMAGSFDGVVVLAGNSAESILVQLVADGEMPKRGPKLTSEQIQTISQWIDAGASNN